MTKHSPQLSSDGVDLIVVRQNMLGIKERAEGAGPPAPAIVYTELTLWVVTFLGFLVAGITFGLGKLIGSAVG